MRVKVHEQSLQILLALLEQPGRVVTRQELQRRLWPADTFVEFENGLNNAISRLREALSDSPDTPRFIETLPRRGYRFVAEVHREKEPPAEKETARPEPAPQVRKWPRWAVGALAIIIVIVALASYLGRSQAEPLDSIAVLPLANANLSGPPGEDYFAGAMTEALTTELSKIGALKVISQTSSRRYKDSEKPLPQIARELGVKAVVEGSVAREGDQVRITVQLIEASTDTHLWAESYQREMRNILALQAEVAQAIARQVRVKLTPQEQAAFAAPRPVNPQAHEAYLKGLYYSWRWPETERHKCVEHFERALQIDPDYAPAHAGLAYYYVEADDQPRSETMPKAKAHALKALQLDGRSLDARWTLAFVLTTEWDWAGAEREFQRVFELDSGHSGARRDYAFLLAVLGRHEEASANIVRAKERDPAWAAVYGMAGRVSFFARRFDQAITEVRAALALGPDEIIGRQDLAMYYYHAGRYEEAIVELNNLLRTTGRFSLFVSLLAAAKAKSGQTAEARKLLEEVKAIAKKENVPPTWFVPVYAGLGENERVLESLERAYKERDWYLIWLTSPWLDPVRNDPRYHNLLRRMNLPQ